MIKANTIELVAIDKIIPNPNNRNTHTEEQIERLVKLIEYQGFRAPLTISNRTGQMVAGHGRLLAAKRLGLTHLPCMFQDFEDEDQEFAAGIADNAIAAWSEQDLKNINIDLTKLGPFEIDLLGLRNFTVDPAEKETEDGNKKRKAKMVTCPECHWTFELPKK